MCLFAFFAILGVSATHAYAETEPNNGFGSEETIAINSSTPGDNGDDTSDYFKIENPTGGNIKIDFSFTTQNVGNSQIVFRILDGGFEDVLEESLGSTSGPVSITISPATETMSMVPIDMSSFIIVIEFDPPPGTISYTIDVTDPSAAAAAAGADAAATAAAKSRLSRSIKKLKGKIKKASGSKAKKLKKKLKKLKKQLKAL